MTPSEESRHLIEAIHNALCWMNRPTPFLVRFAPSEN